MVFQTLRERLKVLEANRKVRIFSKRYGMYLMSGIVAEIENKLPNELIDFRVSGITENLDNQVVTLIVD